MTSHRDIYGDGRYSFEAGGAEDLREVSTKKRRANRSPVFGLGYRKLAILCFVAGVAGAVTSDWMDGDTKAEVPADLFCRATIDESFDVDGGGWLDTLGDSGLSVDDYDVGVAVLRRLNKGEPRYDEPYLRLHDCVEQQAHEALKVELQPGEALHSYLREDGAAVVLVVSP